MLTHDLFAVANLLVFRGMYNLYMSMLGMCCITDEFASLLQYARSLQFSEPPDYAQLSRSFRDLMNRRGWVCDWNFDWLAVPLVSLTGSTLPAVLVYTTFCRRCCCC